MVTVGRVSFSSVTPNLTATIGVQHAVPGHARLALLRGRLASYSTRGCEGQRTIEDTGDIHLSGMTFVTAVAKCGSEDEEVNGHASAVTYILGVALARGTEWTFAFETRERHLAVIRRTYILPMLKSLDLRR